MEHLMELVKKRRKIGERPSYTKGGNYNDLVEYKRIGDLILAEVDRLYDERRKGDHHNE